MLVELVVVIVLLKVKEDIMVAEVLALVQVVMLLVLEVELLILE